LGVTIAIKVTVPGLAQAPHRVCLEAAGVVIVLLSLACSGVLRAGGLARHMFSGADRPAQLVGSFGPDRDRYEGRVLAMSR
jgi:hypothetical protein